MANDTRKKEMAKYTAAEEMRTISVTRTKETRSMKEEKEI